MVLGGGSVVMRLVLNCYYIVIGFALVLVLHWYWYNIGIGITLVLVLHWMSVQSIGGF